MGHLYSFLICRLDSTPLMSSSAKQVPKALQSVERSKETYNFGDKSKPQQQHQPHSFHRKDSNHQLSEEISQKSQDYYQEYHQQGYQDYQQDYQQNYQPDYQPDYQQKGQKISNKSIDEQLVRRLELIRDYLNTHRDYYHSKDRNTQKATTDREQDTRGNWKAQQGVAKSPRTVKR